MNSEILHHIPPSLIMILGSIFLCVPKRFYIRMFFALLIPALTIYQIWDIAHIVDPEPFTVRFWNFTLSPLHINPYSLIFSLGFAGVTLVNGLYSVMHSRASEMVAALVSAGCAIGICFTGDFITLFMYWEILAIASCTIIFSSREKFAGKAGTRYAIMQLLSGMLLLAGIIAQYNLTGSTELVRFAAEMEILFPGFALDNNGIIIWLILLSMLIGAAAPPFSSWLPDSYPKASPGGMVSLSLYTTKTAVFVLIMLFPATKLLVYLGLVMVFYGIVYAILENNIRRMLAYSMVNQVGFMLVGIGVGTDAALAGVALMACCHMVYNSLLLMCAGAVVQMTGKDRFSNLGGIAHSMRFTAIAAIVGGLTVAAFPLTAGFVSKSIISSEVADEGLSGLWFLLITASACVFLHAGMKFPWLTFFGKDSGQRPSDPPLNMCIAMMLLVIMCLIPGIPSLTQPLLYSLLPLPVEYVAYTQEHLITTLQLLLFSMLAFFLLLPLLKPSKSITLDFDWVYRGFARYIILALFMITLVPTQFARILIKKAVRKVGQVMYEIHGPGGILARNWAIGTSLMWTILLLGVYLVIYYFAGTGKISLPAFKS